MAEKEIEAETCLSCDHFGFCMVYWGAECKRQGGKKIPRMKSMSLAGKRRLDKWDAKKQKEPKNLTVEMFEPIRTKIANW